MKPSPKFLIIFTREYLTRIKAKSFLLTTFLAPLAFAALIFVPALAGRFMESEEYVVKIEDPSGKVAPQLLKLSEETMRFEVIDKTLAQAQKDVLTNKHAAVLVLPEDDSKAQLNATFYAGQTPSLKFENKLDDKLQTIYRELRLKQAGLSSEKIAGTEVKLDLTTKKITEKGEEEGSALLGMVLGQGMAFLNYIMVLVYGSLLMRGAMEEKTSRMMEIIISCVKPIELMMGKIFAIALVGLTQFTLWVLLVGGLTFIAGIAFGLNGAGEAAMQSAGDTGVNNAAMAAKVTAALSQFKLSLIFYFIYYFLGGYLLYGALFAAIGASIDQETDGQQLTTIITIPFIASIGILTGIINNPNGPLAFWLSIIPLFSPTIMMARMAATDVPIWEILLSMAFLALGVWGAIALAARIYRVGVLMYGKKLTFGELWKWVTIKN